jgi:predicted enzyme related to lactoylglutathione lyase
MKPRDGYPQGVTCWVDTDLPDPEAATEFYGGLFGWEFEDQMPAEQPGHYFAARLRGLDVAGIGSRPDGATWPPAWNTYVWVESADEAAAAVKGAGGAVLMDPFDVLEAGRMAVVADPQGAAFNVWEAHKHRGAQLVNEPGSWNFSGLTTSDPEAAIVFYGAVFGWEADWAEDEWSFFRVPGYGDYLERSNPGLRRQLAENDAPPGFEDATAWLMSMAGQPEGTPPNWGVTFAVDDADATAARAAELGGRVVVEPFDSPPVRMAVLSDPQGAVFTVGKYDPDME